MMIRVKIFLLNITGLTERRRGRDVRNLKRIKKNSKGWIPTTTEMTKPLQAGLSLTQAVGLKN
jgi:hypothetical protein